MDEMITYLFEEVNRYRGLAQLASEEKFKTDYLHKSDVLESAADVIRKVRDGEP